MIVVFAMEGRLGKTCRLPFDRQAYFDRYMAVRKNGGAPDVTLAAARRFWTRYLKAFDRTSARRGLQVCGDELLEAYHRAKDRLDRELK